MSYYEQAKGINDELKQLFYTDNIQQFTPEQQNTILNIILRFGRIAKFRCRSNTAYTSFSEICFKDIAKVEWISVENTDYQSIRATIIKKPLHSI